MTWHIDTNTIWNWWQNVVRDYKYFSLMITTTLIPTEATKVSSIYPCFAKLTADLQAISEEYNVSQTLMLCLLKDYCDRRLSCPID